MMMAAFSANMKTEVSVNLIPTATQSDDKDEAGNSEFKKLTMRPYHTAKAIRFFALFTFFILGLFGLFVGIRFTINEAYSMIYMKYPSWHYSDFKQQHGGEIRAYVTPASLVLYYSS